MKVDSILIDEPDELKDMEETIQRSVDRVFGGVSAIQKQTVNGKIEIIKINLDVQMNFISFQSFVDFLVR